MKKLMLTVVVVAIVCAMNNSSLAKGKGALSIGADVLIPTGDFGDAVGTAFSGSVRGQYNVTPMFAITLTSGYYVWGTEEFTETVAGLATVTAEAGFKGVPVLVGAKYYFMPNPGPRVYGMGELGVFFGTATATVSASVLGQTVTAEASESSTNFAFAPALGVEIPIGASGSTTIDVSARFFGIGTEGESSNSIGGRIGVNIALGN